MFYGMQNIIYINAYIKYCLNTYSRIEHPMNRRKFNVDLCDQLVFPHMRNRLSNPHLQRNLRLLISDFLGIPINPERPPLPGARKTCFYCPSIKRRMTTTYCNHCHQPIWSNMLCPVQRREVRTESNMLCLVWWRKVRTYSKTLSLIIFIKYKK